MTIQQSNNHQIVNVLSLILGILSFIGSFIPCFGIYAIYGAVVGFILGIVGMNLAKKAGAGQGLATAGIVLSILGGIVALWQASKLS